MGIICNNLNQCQYIAKEHKIENNFKYIILHLKENSLWQKQFSWILNKFIIFLSYLQQQIVFDYHSIKKHEYYEFNLLILSSHTLIEKIQHKSEHEINDNDHKY